MLVSVANKLDDLSVYGSSSYVNLESEAHDKKVTKSFFLSHHGNSVDKHTASTGLAAVVLNK